MSNDASAPKGKAPRDEPQSLRARAVSVALTVKDLEKSLDWYQRVVGFTVADRYEKDGKLVGVSIKAGSVEFFLGQDDGAKGWDRVKGAGMSLQLVTAQRVDEIAQHIRDAGGTLKSEPADMPWGARLFRIEDPDGFTLVISSG